MTNTVTRPKEFDDRVMQYLPGLRGLANKLGLRGEEADDLVTETVIEVLERWQNYREGGGFWNWLYWTMRGRHTNARDKKKLPMSQRPIDDYEYSLSTLPSQEGYAELSCTLSRLTGRNGSVLVHRAMGDTLDEVGAIIGVNRERVRQIEMAEREKLRAAA